MKKYFLTIMAIGLVLASVSIAQEFHIADRATINWDQDLGNIPAAEIKWNVYMTNAVTDPGKANPAKIATAIGKPYTIVFSVEGKYYVGVSAVRIIDGSVIGETDILWADTQTDVPAFGFKYFTLPPMPKKIIKQ